MTGDYRTENGDKGRFIACIRKLWRTLKKFIAENSIRDFFVLNVIYSNEKLE